MWSVLGARWLTPSEELAAMGYPTQPEFAAAMQMPQFDMNSVGADQARKLLGNGFHVANAAVVLLVALSCVRLQD